MKTWLLRQKSSVCLQNEIYYETHERISIILFHQLVNIYLLIHSTVLSALRRSG